MLDFSYLCGIIMDIKTRAIVLRTVKYGESRMIVDMLTQVRGRVSFVCNLSKSNRGKMKKQLFQPLTILDVIYDERPTMELQRLRDIRIARPFTSIPFDPFKLSICLFIAEFLTFATRGEHDNQPLEAFVESSLAWLDSADSNFANFHLVFMIHVTLFVGFYPNLEDWHEGSWFDLREGSFTLQCPLHPDYLSPAEAARLRLLMRMNFDNMRLFRMSHDERNICTTVILKYYRLHVPGFPELRSLEVLRELF